VHFLTLDSTNHEFGPGSSASYTAMAFLDDRVKQILGAIEESGRASQTTVFIVSDHGFRSVQKEIRPNILLRQKGFAKASGESVSVIPDGGVAMVYVTDPAQRTALPPRLRTLFQNLEGVDHVYDASQFASLGLPTRGQSDQAPDLLLSAKQGYLFGDATTGNVISPSKDRGAHGYLSDDSSMQAIFIASGAGIKKGVRLPQIPTVDIAPTIAALLGLDMKNVSGRTIREILEAPSVH